MNIEKKDFHKAIIDSKSLLGYVHIADSNRRLPGDGHIDFSSIVTSFKKNRLYWIFI